MKPELRAYGKTITVFIPREKTARARLLRQVKAIRRWAKLRREREAFIDSFTNDSIIIARKTGTVHI